MADGAPPDEGYGDIVSSRAKAFFRGVIDTAFLVGTGAASALAHWILHDVLSIPVGIDTVVVAVLQVIFAITTVGAMGIYAVRDLVRLFRREFA